MSGGFRAALLTGWVVLGAAGIFYARAKGIPTGPALPVLAAFLLEYLFYLVPAFPTVRDQLAGRRLPLYLTVSAVLPYLVCCLGSVDFHWSSLARMAALGLAVSLWYVVLPVNILVDIGFLAMIPAVLLGKYFEPVFQPGFRDMVVLGHLTQIHLVVMALMLERRVPDFGYGFLPSRREWSIGILYFLGFLAVGLPLAMFLGATKPLHPVAPWKIVGQFFGFLWVVSLSEEYFVRGALMQWVEEWTWSPRAALVISSLVFGLVHLGFGGRFPNWPWVAITFLLGMFCGVARRQAGSIRAGMVTHALVATAQLFFR
jgi:uncharacterized protein